MFKIGQILPSNSPSVDVVRPVTVKAHGIKTFRKNLDERNAFAYENEDETFTITGLLAIDREKEELLVAHPDGTCEIVKQHCIYYVNGTLDLTETDMSLFKKYYPHL